MRWRTLTRRGFVIPHLSGQSVVGKALFSDFIKHPATLIVLGFVLTGLVGRYLASIQNENQRQREAVVKSMDELRASIDDLASTFAEYHQRAAKVITLRELGASPADMVPALAAYSDAYIKMQERLAVDGTNIEQRYPPLPNHRGMDEVIYDIRAGLGFVDTCVGGGRPTLTVGTNAVTARELLCVDTNKASITARSRLSAYFLCVSLLTSKLRPDPKYDFTENTDWRRGLYADTLMKACDVRRLIGLVRFDGQISK